MDAQALCARIRADLADIDEHIRGNSWLADLTAGVLGVADLHAFAGEQLQVVPSDLSSFEMLLQRFPADPARSYLAGMAAGERVALSALRIFAAAIGFTDVARDVYEPIPGCQAYPSFLARLARDGTPAEVAGAFLVNLDTWGYCCARMMSALLGTYNLAEQDCVFFAHFAGPTGELEQISLDVIDAGLEQGADPVRIARAARLLQAYELLFWNSLPG